MRELHTELKSSSAASAAELERQRLLDEAVRRAYGPCVGSMHKALEWGGLPNRWREAVLKHWQQVQYERAFERARLKAASGTRGAVAARNAMRRVRNEQLREALR